MYVVVIVVCQFRSVRQLFEWKQSESTCGTWGDPDVGVERDMQIEFQIVIGLYEAFIFNGVFIRCH